MFVMQAGDLNAVTTLEVGWSNAGATRSSGAVLGMQLQRGLEISGLVGHVYPCARMCVCVWKGGGVEGETDRQEREMKLQRQHTRPACSSSPFMFARLQMSSVFEDMLSHAQHRG